MFTDDPSYDHFVGTENELSAQLTPFKQYFFNGYIFELCFYNTVKTNFADQIRSEDCGQLMCDVCPTEECLTTCEWNEYLDYSDP
jgi:hypothetical protein